MSNFDPFLSWSVGAITISNREMYRARGNVIRDAGQIAGNERPENDDTNWELVAEGNAAILLENGGGVTFDSTTNAAEVNAALGVPLIYTLSGTGIDRTATVSPAASGASTEINDAMRTYIDDLGFHVTPWRDDVDYKPLDIVSFEIPIGGLNSTGQSDTSVPPRPTVVHFQYLGGAPASMLPDRPVTMRPTGAGIVSTQWAIAPGTIIPHYVTSPSTQRGLLQYANGCYVTYAGHIYRAVGNVLQVAGVVDAPDGSEAEWEQESTTFDTPAIVSTGVSLTPLEFNGTNVNAPSVQTLLEAPLRYFNISQTSQREERIDLTAGGIDLRGAWNRFASTSSLAIEVGTQNYPDPSDSSTQVTVTWPTINGERIATESLPANLSAEERRVVDASTSNGVQNVISTTQKEGGFLERTVGGVIEGTGETNSGDVATTDLFGNGQVAEWLGNVDDIWTLNFNDTISTIDFSNVQVGDGYILRVANDNEAATALPEITAGLIPAGDYYVFVGAPSSGPHVINFDPRTVRRIYADGTVGNHIGDLALAGMHSIPFPAGSLTVVPATDNIERQISTTNNETEIGFSDSGLRVNRALEVNGSTQTSELMASNFGNNITGTYPTFWGLIEGSYRLSVANANFNDIALGDPFLIRVTLDSGQGIVPVGNYVAYRTNSPDPDDANIIWFDVNRIHILLADGTLGAPLVLRSSLNWPANSYQFSTVDIAPQFSVRLEDNSDYDFRPDGIYLNNGIVAGRFESLLAEHDVLIETDIPILATDVELNRLYNFRIYTRNFEGISRDVNFTDFRLLSPHIEGRTTQLGPIRADAAAVDNPTAVTPMAVHRFQVSWDATSIATLRDFATRATTDPEYQVFTRPAVNIPGVGVFLANHEVGLSGSNFVSSTGTEVEGRPIVWAADDNNIRSQEGIYRITTNLPVQTETIADDTTHEYWIRIDTYTAHTSDIVVRSHGSNVVGLNKLDATNLHLGAGENVFTFTLSTGQINAWNNNVAATPPSFAGFVIADQDGEP